LRRVCAGWFFFFATLAASGAEPLVGPSAFVADLAQRTLLNDAGGALSLTERQERFSQFLDGSFDVPEIAQFVVGRYWDKASSADRDSFTAVFRDFMAQTYARRFTVYHGQSLKILSVLTDQPNSTMVLTQLTQANDAAPLTLGWRVVNHDGLRVVDVEVAGISMANMQRDDFVTFLQQHGGRLGSLIEQLHTRLDLRETPAH
jgi:phospholipid transport system substrate-binding protein